MAKKKEVTTEKGDISRGVLTLYYMYGTFSDLTTLDTLNGSSSLNMQRVRPILVSLNVEINSTHFYSKICIPLEKGLTGL